MDMKIEEVLKTRNTSMDFFRGVAALLVAVGHYLSWHGYFLIPRSFFLSVDFFLVLSGFVICNSIINKKEKFDAFVFFVDRYGRLLPVYFAGIIFAYISAKVFFSVSFDNSAFDLFRLILMMQMLAFNGNVPANPLMVDVSHISYTISAELWVGCILFPIVVHIFNCGRHVLFSFLMAIILFSLTFLSRTSPNYLDVHWQLYNNFVYFGLIRCVMDYSFGIFSYFVFLKIMHLRKTLVISTMQILPLVLILAIFCRSNYDHNDQFIAPLLFSVLIIFIAFQKGIIYKLTCGKFGKFLGDISYPAYIFHPTISSICADYFKFDVKNTFQTIIYFLAVVTISYLVHIFIEKPCLKRPLSKLLN